MSNQGSSPLVLLSKIESKLLDMEEKKRVDLAILSYLDELIGLAKSQERALDVNENAGKMDVFGQFHSWRNCRLVLSKMKDRFHEAEARHENPVVAINALDVLPALVISFGLLYTKDADSHALLEQSRILRETAAKANMLPDLHEEIKEVDPKELSRGLSRITETLGSELLEN